MSALKRALGIAPDAPVIGSVGRFSEQKGYRYFLEAAALLARDLPQARFVLVGSGETESALKTQADALNLGEKIIFTGARDDVETLLPIMDVFVSSSLWEGLPTVILEAMLAETPVVATAVAGTTELVEDGVTGALVPAAGCRAVGGGSPIYVGRSCTLCCDGATRTRFRTRSLRYRADRPPAGRSLPAASRQMKPERINDAKRKRGTRISGITRTEESRIF
ncbi:MAG: glycosyltransferase [Caldilineaceae bacterium]